MSDYYDSGRGYSDDYDDYEDISGDGSRGGSDSSSDGGSDANTHHCHVHDDYEYNNHGHYEQSASAGHSSRGKQDSSSSGGSCVTHIGYSRYSESSTGDRHSVYDDGASRVSEQSAYSRDYDQRSVYSQASSRYDQEPYDDNASFVTARDSQESSVHATSARSPPRASQGRTMSDYEFTKSWGGTHHFMRSYGINPSNHGDYGEYRELINAMRTAGGYGLSPLQQSAQDTGYEGIYHSRVQGGGSEGGYRAASQGQGDRQSDQPTYWDYNQSGYARAQPSVAGSYEGMAHANGYGQSYSRGPSQSGGYEGDYRRPSQTTYQQGSYSPQGIGYGPSGHSQGSRYDDQGPSQAIPYQQSFYPSQRSGYAGSGHPQGSESGTRGLFRETTYQQQKSYPARTSGYYGGSGHPQGTGYGIPGYYPGLRGVYRI